MSGIGFSRQEMDDTDKAKALLCRLAEVQYELTVFKRLMDTNEDLGGVIPDIWNNRLAERRRIWREICANPVMAVGGDVEKQLAELQMKIEDRWGNPS